jgi:hypothetical protein
MANEDYYSRTYTDTGQKEILPVNKNHDVAIGLRAGATDVVDVEVTYDNTDKANPSRTKALIGQSGEVAKTTDGPVTGIGLNITTNNSGNIVLEIRTAYRGG